MKSLSSPSTRDCLMMLRPPVSNNRLEFIDSHVVRFHYPDNKTHEIRHVTLPGVEFIARFLQHVLPRGCVKVLYYGIWSPSCRKQLECARKLLSALSPC